MRDIVKTLIEIAIPLASFATGLRAASVDPLWLFKHTGLLVRSLLTILVIVPVGTVAFLQSIGAPPLVKAGLTIAVIAIGIGPPAFFGQTKKAVKEKASELGPEHDALSFEIGLNVLLLVLAIVFIPAFVAVHGAFFHHELSLSPAAVARVVFMRALIPLAIGVAVARFAPRAVSPLGRIAGLFVVVVLLAVIVLAIVMTWRDLVGLGGRAWLTAGAIVLGEVLIGHALGGPELATRRVLASFSAMRFPALALLFVKLLPHGKEIVPVVLAYVLLAAVVVAVHGALTARRSHGHAGTPRGRGVPRIPVRGVPNAT